MVDLNPSGFDESLAAAVFGTTVVGWYEPQGGAMHAMLWHGTSSITVDLHPKGSLFLSSAAVGVSDTLQVGSGFLISGQSHALLWSGTAASVIDLNPPGYQSSQAYAVSGSIEVGSGTDGTLLPNGRAIGHALAWSGTASSFVDLNTFLPAGFTSATAVRHF